MGCAHEWKGLPGPSKRPPQSHENNPDTICPACGSLYMEWLNFDEWQGGNVRRDSRIPKPPSQHRHRRKLGAILHSHRS